MQIQIAAQYKDDDRVVLGFSKFGCGGVRAEAKLGRKGVNRNYVLNTVRLALDSIGVLITLALDNIGVSMHPQAFTNFWVGGVLTNDMVIVN